MFQGTLPQFNSANHKSLWLILLNQYHHFHLSMLIDDLDEKISNREQLVPTAGKHGDAVI